VTLCPNDGQTSGFPDTFPELDVRTPSCHVGGNGHRTCPPRLCNDFGLPGMLFGVEHVVLDTSHLQHTAKQLGDLDRGCSHQYRPSGFGQLVNLVYDSIVFLTFCLVYQVFLIFSYHRAVCRDDHHIQLVYGPELTCFCFCGTGHTGQLVVHAEIILQGDGGKGLGGRLNLYPFLGFNSLVQSV